MLARYRSRFSTSYPVAKPSFAVSCLFKNIFFCINPITHSQFKAHLLSTPSFIQSYNPFPSLFQSHFPSTSRISLLSSTPTSSLPISSSSISSSSSSRATLSSSNSQFLCDRNVNDTDLDSQQVTQLRNLLLQYHACFRDKPGRTSLTQHHIDTGNTKPITSVSRIPSSSRYHLSSNSTNATG